METKKVNYSKSARANRVYDVLSIVSGTLACLFHILGEAVPGWWVLEETDAQGRNVKYYFSAWSTRICLSGSCNTEMARMSGDRAWIIGPAVLILIAGMLLIGIVTLMTLSLVRTWGPPVQKLCVLLSAGAGYRELLYGNSVSNFVLEPGAGGIILLAILIFVKKKAGLRPSTAPDTSDGIPGWTLIISIVGSILALMNAVIIGIGVAKNYKGERPPTAQLNMEIEVKGNIIVSPISADLASKRAIQNKQKYPRRDSGMVFYTERIEKL